MLVVGAGVAAGGGTLHLAMAAAAVGLSFPPAALTLWLTHWFVRRHPLGGILGMAVGVVLRATVAVGGAAALFLTVDAFRAARLGFWLWVLFAYLSTLVAETAVLARSGSLGRGMAGTGKG